MKKIIITICLFFMQIVSFGQYTYPNAYTVGIGGTNENINKYVEIIIQYNEQSLSTVNSGSFDIKPISGFDHITKIELVQYSGWMAKDDYINVMGNTFTYGGLNSSYNNSGEFYICTPEYGTRTPPRHATTGPIAIGPVDLTSSQNILSFSFTNTNNEYSQLPSACIPPYRNYEMVVGVLFKVTGCKGQIQTPTNLNEITIGTNATLGWGSVSGNAGYDIQWKKSSDANYNNSSAGSGSSNTTLSNLIPGQTYKWRIKTKTTTCAGDWSAERSFTTPGGPGGPVVCKAPTILGGSDFSNNDTNLGVTGTGYTINWSPVAAAIGGYKITFSSPATATLPAYESSLFESLTSITSLVPHDGRVYTIKIQSRCSNNQLGDFSEPFEYKVPGGACKADQETYNFSDLTDNKTYSPASKTTRFCADSGACVGDSNFIDPFSEGLVIPWDGIGPISFEPAVNVGNCQLVVLRDQGNDKWARLTSVSNYTPQIINENEQESFRLFKFCNGKYCKIGNLIFKKIKKCPIPKGIYAKRVNNCESLIDERDSDKGFQLYWQDTGGIGYEIRVTSPATATQTAYLQITTNVIPAAFFRAKDDGRVYTVLIKTTCSDLASGGLQSENSEPFIYTAPTYYSTATGTGYELKTQLFDIIKCHTDLGYNGLWTTYATSDTYDGDKIRDIYSNSGGSGPNPYTYTYGSNQCANVSGGENTCYNREHIVPQSTFSGALPMFADAHFITPTDLKVNSVRKNYPHGYVANASFTSLNGSKLGTSAVPNYSGTVFEPIDAFKGDIARMYFYFATRYESTVSSYSFNMFNGSSNQVFTDAFKNMLLLWNEQDPVDAQEEKRNEAIYARQGCRNPFIDRPSFVNAIWGNPTQIACAAPVPSNFNGNTFDDGPDQVGVNLWWDNVSNNNGVVGYDVNISAAATSNDNLLNKNYSFSNSGARIVLNPLTNDRKYTIKVRSKCANGGFSNYSTTKDFYLSSGCKKPTNLHAIGENYGQLITRGARMYWDGMNGVSQYEMQYAANTSFTDDFYSKIVDGTNTTVNTSTATYESYFVRVRSLCSTTLKSDWSNIATFNVNGTPTSSARTSNQDTQINSDNSNEALKSVSTTNANGNLTNSISASPNPFKEYLNVRYNVLGNEPNYFTIIDFLGRQVYESKHQVSEKGTLLDENFDSTALPNGVYVLITHNGSFATNFTRVIKQ